MKHNILVLFLLVLLPVASQAQSVGRVRHGDRVFSTNFPAKIPDEYFENGGPKLPKERREIALRCIERTFGKVKEYTEHWGDCTGEHIFTAILESGDTLYFDDGRLGTYTIVSPRFTIDAEMFPGGLKVGRKPPKGAKKGVVLEQDEKDPSLYHYYWKDTEFYGHYRLDENGRISEIGTWDNAC